MLFSLNNFVRRTVAGISALCIVACSCSELSGRYPFVSVPVNAADTEDELAPGDVNCDGKVDISDVKELSAYLRDPGSSPVTEQGRLNARAAYFHYTNSYYPDYFDVQAIIEYLAGLNELGTTALVTPAVAVVPGDCDCDGYVDRKDLDALNKYLKDYNTDPLTDQGRINARASFFHYTSSYYPDSNDVQTIIEYLAGVNLLEANSNNAQPFSVIPGDCDCDGDVDFDDISALNKYLKDYDENPLTDQGRINARASYFHYTNSYYPDRSDVQAIFEYLAGINLLESKTISEVEYAIVPGDADCDGDTDLDDVTALLDYLSDYDKYPLTDQGRINARAAYFHYTNSYYPDKNDAQAILEYLAGINILETMTMKLPSDSLSYDTGDKVLYGDFNCDGKVDKKDTSALSDFLADPTGRTISAEQIRNCDVYNPGSGLDAEDVQAISDSISGERVLPYSTSKYTKDKNKAGDFNCDNTVDISDVIMLNNYLRDKSSYSPSEQGRKNANVYRPDSTGLNFDDAAAITEFIAGKYKLPTNTIIARGSTTLAGDFNCDQKVDVTDALMLNTYLSDKSSYAPSEQGLTNADAFKPGSGITFEDVIAIAENVAEKYDLPTDELVPIRNKYRYGDFNCDKVFNVADTWMLYRYIEGFDEYSPSEQGRSNADVSGPAGEYDYSDLDRLLKSLRTGTNITDDTEPSTTPVTTAASAKPAVTTTTKAAATKPATTAATKAAATKPVTTAATKAAATKPATTAATKAVATKPATTAATKAAATKPATTAATKAAATKPATTAATKAAATKPATTAVTKSAATTALPVTTVPVTTAPAVMKGDVNKDGSVDSSDASEVLLIYASASTGGKTPEDISKIADLNGDDLIDSNDATLILEYYGFVSTGGTKTPNEYFAGK